MTDDAGGSGDGHRVGVAETLRWVDRLPPLEATVRCGGDLHRVRWVRGALVACDHDLAAETALGALGGTPPPCVQVLTAVRRYVASVAPLTMWAVDADPTGLATTGTPAPWSSEDERLLDALRTLPLPFRRRLALSFHVAWARRGLPLASWQQHPAGAVLGHALRTTFDSARRTVLATAPTGGASAPLDVRWQTVAEGSRPWAEGTAGPRGSWVRVAVPMSWLATRWACDDALTAAADAVVLARGHSTDRQRARRPGSVGPALVAVWRPEPTGERWTLGTTVVDDRRGTLPPPS